jgi:hypothetical protein
VRAAQALFGGLTYLQILARIGGLVATLNRGIPMADQDLRSATPPALRSATPVVHDFRRVKEALKERIEAEILSEVRDRPRKGPAKFSQVSHGQEMSDRPGGIPLMAELEGEIEEFAARLAAAD